MFVMAQSIVQFDLCIKRNVADPPDLLKPFMQNK